MADAPYDRLMLEVRRLSAAALLMLPGGLVLYFAFNSGGFYPGAPAFIAMLLCLSLLLRVSVSLTPVAGLSWQLVLAAGALSGLAIVTLATGSQAPGVARVEFDLPLVYLLAMLTFGLIARSRTRLRWMLRALAAAALIVCACGLVSRVLPHVWPTSSGVASNRLSFPVTYWNVLGLLAAIGIVLCVHLTSDQAEPRAVRALSAAAVPVLATTLFFTFSRGAIACCAIALAVYVVIGHPRGLLSMLLAVGPATAVAIKVAYDANWLATPTPTIAAAMAQGRHVAIAVAGCLVAAALVRLALAHTLDGMLARASLPPYLGPLRHWPTGISLAVAGLIAILLINGTLAHEYHRFVHPTTTNPQDFRARLTDPGNNGRLEYWRIAWRGFKNAPVAGHGPGSFADAWALHRKEDQPVLDAHSLYVETLYELGIVGFVLLMITLLTILVRVALRCRGSGRPLYAAVFAVLVAWALHAGVDWDWEMPVVSIVFFSLGGFALARREKPIQGEAAAARGGAPRLVRVAVAAAFLLLAVLPAYTWLSQRDLDRADFAFAHGDCKAARQSALSSISFLGNRSQPYELVGYCDVRLGMPHQALAAIDKAVSLDPRDWTYRYDQALIQAAAGLDPRATAKYALALNPLDPDVQDEVRMFSTGSRAQWQVRATDLAGTFDTL